MNLVNCTPHAITLRAENGDDTVIAPSGLMPRVSSTPGRPTIVAGCPVPIYTADTFGAVENLPEPIEGTLYIVSGMVLAALAGTRPDVCAPGTGPADAPIRNDKGHVVAVTRLKF